MEYIILWVLALFGIWNIISRIVENMYIDNEVGNIEVVIKVENEGIEVENLVKRLEKIDQIKKVSIIKYDLTDKNLHKLE